MKKVSIIILFTCFFIQKNNAQFVVAVPEVAGILSATNPLIVSALERGNATSLSSFQEAVSSGISLGQIVGMQEDVLNMYNNTASYVHGTVLYGTILEQLVLLGKNIEDLAAYQRFYNNSSGASRSMGVFVQIKNMFFLINDLVKVSTGDKLTPGDRMNILKIVSESLIGVNKLISNVKQVITANLSTSLTTVKLNSMMFNNTFGFQELPSFWNKNDKENNKK